MNSMEKKVFELLAQYFDNKAKSKQLRVVRTKFVVSDQHFCEKSAFVGADVVTCHDKYKNKDYEGDDKYDLCEYCKRMKELYEEISRLGAANSGIMKSLKAITKKQANGFKTVFR